MVYWSHQTRESLKKSVCKSILPFAISAVLSCLKVSFEEVTCSKDYLYVDNIYIGANSSAEDTLRTSLQGG